jgi:vancomycin permeability regulator SanA
MKFKRLLIALTISAAVVAGLLVYLANRRVNQATSERLYTSVDKVPQERVCLVLGCSPKLHRGSFSNPFFRNRIQAAAQLWKSGKSRYFILSGDNHSKSYDEPTAMKTALVEAGVPESAIFLDYAGFSTFESVLRAREIFGLKELCIVSQADHAQRALYIADHLGLKAVGFAAQEVGFRYGVRTRIREALARARTVLDLTILRRKPHFLGPKVEIPAEKD